ncbi:10503_t:CDS:2 [Paraglomus brasilianum]|uniref:10503_t:CDS:1 n=1 Tax=Paraglomus brasilianum TaxID=144538 RepID=A0A9N9BTT4_9GLOM|nr:10503_t:CDS:2 [Paraglomus brasilianum]
MPDPGCCFPMLCYVYLQVMFESTVEDYLNDTAYTEWSILSILEHVERKKKIYVDDVEDLKKAIYNTLQHYKFKRFLRHLVIKEEEENLRISVQQNMTATYTVEALKDHRRNKDAQRQLQLEDHMETLKSASLQNALDDANMLDENIRISERKRRGEELPSTPPNKVRTIDTDAFQQEQNSSYNGESDSDSDSEVVKSIPLPNVFIDVSSSQQQTSAVLVESVDMDEVNTDSSLSLVSGKDKKQKTTRKYIRNDLANEVLNSYKTRVLPADQIQDYETTAVYFADKRYIDKFIVDCEEEVLDFLNKFQEIEDLESLARCLNENAIDMSVASNDLIFVRNLFDHFYFLFKNDTLLQPMSEHEFSVYVWTPLIRNAFLGKDDLKLRCGELASKSYEKLKEMLNVASCGGPKLDGKGFLKSLGTEILVQEDGILNTYSKRTGDLQKLEYCSKVILTALFFALPSATKDNITNIETYTLQSNGFHLKISASKYLFENTIITMDLQHVEIPRTVEGFSKLVVGAKTILSWKARTRKNTMRFYEALNNGHKRLINGVFFSPVKLSV